MKKELEANDNTERDQSGDQRNPRSVQGEALKMNDNNAGGKKSARVSEPPDAGKPNPHKIQGKALQCERKERGRIEPRQTSARLTNFH
jgi:hypothetical protein